MILVCGGIKGGSGKTTIATNFAIMRALAGRDVLLVDADDQESATDFTVLRNETTHDQCGYTSIQLRDRSVLTLADVLMVPFVPRSLDVWTLEKVQTLIEDLHVIHPALRAYAFLNRADSIGTENAQARDVLAEAPSVTYLDAPLGSRKALGKAIAQGQAVVELKPPDRKATEEITALYRCVFGA